MDEDHWLGMTMQLLMGGGLPSTVSFSNSQPTRSWEDNAPFGEQAEDQENDDDFPHSEEEGEEGSGAEEEEITPEEVALRRALRKKRASRYRSMFLLPRFVVDEDGSKRKLRAGEYHPDSKPCKATPIYRYPTPEIDLF